jgi:V-type H+-transporting ATPase 16kDa proteolipid subunit
LPYKISIAAKTKMTVNPELLTGLGAALSIFLTSAGSAMASVPAGKYAIRSSGILSFAPIVIAGVLAIYGIIVAVLLARKIENASDAASGYKNISAGLCVGLACLASGFAMARFLEDSIATSMQQDDATGNTQDQPLLARNRSVNKLLQPSVRFLMVMVFLEAIALYGLIVALFMMW